MEIKNIILPLAISFFTFHIISYLVDMYRNSYTVAKDYIPFIMHISFFPQLVAGPIERVGHLLPQFRTEKKFNTQLLVDGGRQMLWGFFKKLAIADTLSQEVNYIFSNHEALSGSTIAVGVIMFSIQIYCDFSGYTDIALGVARMMGIELLRNFKYPYFSENISDFWQRWHLSLSTWFRDYLYISLGGNRVSIPVMYINVIIVFLVSGLWHGANWTFVVWGGLHGLYWLIENFSRRNFKNGIVKFYFESRYLSPFRILITFGLVSLAWLFFRAKTFTQAWEMLKSIFSNSLFTNPEISQTGLKGLGLAAGMIIIEWIQRKKEHGLQIQGVNYAIRWFAYAIIFMLIFAADNLNKQSEFIYFQF
ncbi:MAG: MBOAT family protein [Bacteroidetes bacterium]|nr:MBOAT family protein [Bacteroidota bacterium]